jgi:uncharacterized membrane protein
VIYIKEKNPNAHVLVAAVVQVTQVLTIIKHQQNYTQVTSILKKNHLY